MINIRHVCDPALGTLPSCSRCSFGPTIPLTDINNLGLISAYKVVLVMMVSGSVSLLGLAGSSYSLAD